MISPPFVLKYRELWWSNKLVDFFFCLPDGQVKLIWGKCPKNVSTMRLGKSRGLLRATFRLPHSCNLLKKKVWKQALFCMLHTCCILNPAMRCICWAASWALRSSLRCARATYNGLDTKIRPFISVTALVASSGDEKHTKPNPLMERETVLIKKPWLCTTKDLWCLIFLITDRPLEKWWGWEEKINAREDMMEKNPCKGELSEGKNIPAEGIALLGW